MKELLKELLLVLLGKMKNSLLYKLKSFSFYITIFFHQGLQ